MYDIVFVSCFEIVTWSSKRYGVICNKNIQISRWWKGLNFVIGIGRGGVQLGPLGTAALKGILCSQGWLWWWRNWWNDWQGKPKYPEKRCPNAALSTINPTCCQDANPCRRGGKPATNRLSYGTAWWYGYKWPLYYEPAGKRNLFQGIDGGRGSISFGMGLRPNHCYDRRSTSLSVW
jgi:hypothetical protein